MPAVRAALVADAGSIAAVHVRAWQVAYRGMVADDHLDGLDVAERTQGWLDILVDGPESRARRGGVDAASNLVAVDDGVVVGFVSVGVDRDEPRLGRGELWALYVDPYQWGAGAGTALIEAGTAILTERFTEAALWVLRDNERARRFYERHGWRPDGTAHDEVIGGHPVPEVRYRRKL